MPKDPPLSILLLDDEDFYHVLFRSLLDAHGAQGRYYTSDATFLAYETPTTLATLDLMLLDYRLKGKTLVSLDLLRVIRHDLHYQGPITVCSTLDHFAHDTDYLKTYADSFVDKTTLSWQTLTELLQLCPT